MDWQPASTLPEKGEDERFAAYLGEYAHDGDALYMTDDGFDVRKEGDEWATYSHFYDGRKVRHVVVGWMEAMKPVPRWQPALATV